MIGRAANKTCDLDPAPTWLIKQSRHLLSPFIADLMNKSLDSGSFPLIYKSAVVFPRL